MNEYDIATALQRIEEDLMASMVRNMDRHRAEELKEGLNWTMWQAEQLKSLEKYKQLNRKKYNKEFKSINKEIEVLIRQAHATGSMEQELSILRAMKRGYKPPRSGSRLTGQFFRLNERKLEALIQATTNDMKKAETAVLRMANDQYRKAIFNAQVYANSGAGTYEKAVDMAVKDMLSSGLNCVEYKNGARHTLPDYADMAIKTANKRAYLQGEGVKRQEWGISTVIMNKRGNPCPKCLPWVGKVLIDDVWSGGKEGDGKYPLMSYAVSKGLYHPRCKDSHTTYFPGISSADDTWTREELKRVGLINNDDAHKQYAARQAEKYRRLSRHSLDAENKNKYQNKAKAWSDAEKSVIIEESAFKRLVIDELPELDAIKDDADRRSFAEQLIERLGIDTDGLTISVQDTSNRGYCVVAANGPICNYDQFVLQKNDDRSVEYKIKTAFHEAYHLSLKGHKWDAIKNQRINEPWRIIEETFAETSAHYALKLYGIDRKLAPSYPEILIQTLPRMKKLTKYKQCADIVDFGKIAWKDRILGTGGVWEDLHKDVFYVKFDEVKYFKQYVKHIENNKTELINKLFENSPSFRQYEADIYKDLDRAVEKLNNGMKVSEMTGNEEFVFSTVLINAMREVGIK